MGEKSREALDLTVFSGDQRKIDVEVVLGGNNGRSDGFQLILVVNLARTLSISSKHSHH